METVKLADLNPAPYNPNYMDKTQTQQLSNSIDTWGYLDPIIVNKRNMVVVGGHQRLTKLLQKGVIEEDVVIVDLDQTNEKALNLALNKIKGQFDETKLESLIEDLQIEGFDVELTGFQETELESLFPEEKLPVIEDDYNPEEVEIEAKVQPGDIWILGNHRLMCGDSTNKEEVELLMDGKLVDMVFTDPPYGVKYEQGKYTGKAKKVFKAIKNDDKQADELFSFISAVFKNVYNKLADGAPVYCCSPPLTESLMILYGLIESNLHIQSQLIWVKNQFILGRADYHWQHEIIWYGYKNSPHYWCNDRTQSTIWEIKKDPPNSYKHPTQKPIELAAKAIQNSSSKNNIILDVFGGSGSTIIACEQLQRNCFMMELDPHYCDVIINRWEEFTGQKAKLLIN
jgi:DNA modification methylase